MEFKNTHVRGSSKLLAEKKQAWPHVGLQAGRNAILLQRTKNAKSFSTRILVWSVIPFLLLLLTHQWMFSAGVVFFVLVAASGAFGNVNGVSEVEYRTLPGSKDEFGKHRCVYCGKSGVFRRGAYASNSTWSECTGCRKHLFVD